MVSFLQHPSIPKHEDNIRILHSSQPMRNNHHGPIPSILLKHSLNSLLRLSIQVRRRFIKQQ